MRTIHRHFPVLIAAPLLLAGACQAADIGTAQREQALRQTAANTTQCKELGDFYWEVGEATHVVAQGAVGTSYRADKPIPIASASKLIFGSYVLEKIGKNTDPTPTQLQALEMQSGYTSMKFMSCVFSGTVESCLDRRRNSAYSPDNVGKFFYNGAHDQKLAVDLGLGAMNATQFGDEINAVLGNGLHFTFGSPQPAGGMQASPGEYGKFLRAILAGNLRMKDFLGTHPVCTAPGSCAGALYSPAAPVAWHYSLNHWVEDDPENGDGAFSSPGAFGFYPWISADKQWYGVLARVSHKPAAYKESVACGILLRRAWLNGAAQVSSSTLP